MLVLVAAAGALVSVVAGAEAGRLLVGASAAGALWASSVHLALHG